MKTLKLPPETAEAFPTYLNNARPRWPLANPENPPLKKPIANPVANPVIIPVLTVSMHVGPRWYMMVSGIYLKLLF